MLSHVLKVHRQCLRLLKCDLIEANPRVLLTLTTFVQYFVNCQVFLLARFQVEGCSATLVILHDLLQGQQFFRLSFFRSVHFH